MERRFNRRLSTDLPVQITPLDEGVERSGQLLDISESGISAIMAVALSPGALVKLDILGLTFYGHVVYSQPDDDIYRAGIFVEPALLDSSNITELVKSHLTAKAI
jgi:hypothetical protein